MDRIMEQYNQLVPFLGAALGDNCEVALLDCRSRQVVAIANGHVSGRSVGAPMTDLAQRIADRRDWVHTDYITNYEGLSCENGVLRSSTYFIKENGELLGMLCVNIDTSSFRQISTLALRLAGLEFPNLHMEQETFVDSATDTIRLTLRETFPAGVPESFSREDRRMVLRQLLSRHVFQVKGAVPRVAKLLGCSEPTIYREISRLNSESGSGGKGEAALVF